MTQPELAEERLRNIEGMPENPREDPASALDALERHVEGERGPEPTGEEGVGERVEAAEDADLPGDDSDPERGRAGVEPPD